MYDFYFGTHEEIKADESKFLLSIKRMLPRWCNSIPDSEYLAILDTLEKFAPKDKPVLVETGVGASTIVLLHYAMKYDGILYSWDMVNPKGAFLRGVCTDTLLQYHHCQLSDYWKFVAYNSLSPHLGIPILNELENKIDACFLDSEHTLNTLLNELDLINPLLAENAVIAIDDANYTYRHTNFSYINIFRKKLGLSELTSPTDNTCQPFYVEVANYLKDKWGVINYIDDTYKTAFQTDIFWSYYQSDRTVMAELGMEKVDELKHRFDAWQVSSRIQET